MVGSEARSGGVMSEKELAALGAPNTVYICEVDADSIRHEIAQDLPPDSGYIFDPGTKFYAVCAADGDRKSVV